MEIIGVGTDIVECLRIARMIQKHGEQFLCRVYTEREIRTCNANKRTTENFAGRWAAKEAVLKALQSRPSALSTCCSNRNPIHLTYAPA